MCGLQLFSPMLKNFGFDSLLASTIFQNSDGEFTIRIGNGGDRGSCLANNMWRATTIAVGSLSPELVAQQSPLGLPHFIHGVSG